MNAKRKGIHMDIHHPPEFTPPPIPPELPDFHPLPSRQKNHSRYVPVVIGLVSVVCILFVLAGAAGFIGLVMADHDSVSDQAYTALEEYDEEYTADEDTFFVFEGSPAGPDQIPVTDGTFKLPGSSISIGLPLKMDVESWEYIPQDSYLFLQLYDDDVSLILLSRKLDTIPLSRSEEEEYFEADYQYQRMEGTEDQYFYTRMDEDDQRLIADIIDRKEGIACRIIVEPVYESSLSDNPDVAKHAWSILNHEILDRSSLCETEDQDK